MPIPRWPASPAPQVTTVPSPRSAMEKSVSAATATTPLRIPGASSAAATGAGPGPFACPSCPASLAPHDSTVPSARTARLCLPPAASRTTGGPGGSTTWANSAALTPDFRPSWASLSAPVLQTVAVRTTDGEARAERGLEGAVAGEGVSGSGPGGSPEQAAVNRMPAMETNTMNERCLGVRGRRAGTRARLGTWTGRGASPALNAEQRFTPPQTGTLLVGCRKSASRVAART